MKVSISFIVFACLVRISDFLKTVFTNLLIQVIFRYVKLKLPYISAKGPVLKGEGHQTLFNNQFWLHVAPETLKPFLTFLPSLGRDAPSICIPGEGVGRVCEQKPKTDSAKNTLVG